MFVDLDGPLNASSLLSASAELLVIFASQLFQAMCGLRGCTVVRIDPLLFLPGCRTRRLKQAVCPLS